MVTEDMKKAHKSWRKGIQIGKCQKKNRGKGLNLFILLLITANAEYLPYAHSNRET